MVSPKLVAAVVCGLAVSLLLWGTGESAPRRRARGAADGGPVLLGTDPPGRLRAEPADAGVKRAAADAGVDATQRQLADLRARVEQLERALQQQQQQGQQLQQIADEVQQLRAQIADAESRRQNEQTQQQATRNQRETAIAALNQAQYALAGGSTDVAGALDQAESAFTGQAQRDVQAARAAVQNRDLSRARTLLNAAILDAQQGR